jgi:Transglutaminase-like superfamily
MFKISRRWAETSKAGHRIQHRLAEFDSIESQLVYLRKMIEIYRATTFAREVALQILRDAEVGDRNKPAQAVAIAEWVRRNVRYINELPETFQTPRRTYDVRAGDCDDHTTLIGTLCENMGIPIEVVGLKVDGVWQHVFPRAVFQAPNGKTVKMPLDSTIKDAEIRQFANPIKRLLDRGKKVEVFIPPSADD